MFSGLLRNGLAALLVAGTTVGPALANDYVFPWSSQYLIPVETLQSLDCNTLWYARNEIYDRNGYIFSSERARAAFGWDGWTRAPQFNHIEQQNIDHIRNWEHRAYCN